EVVDRAVSADRGVSEAVVVDDLPAGVLERPEIGVERTQKVAHCLQARQNSRERDRLPAESGIVLVQREKAHVLFAQVEAARLLRAEGQRAVGLTRRRGTTGDPGLPS